MSTPDTNDPDAVQKVADLAKDIKIAMLTTIDADDGHLTARPMAQQEVEFDGDLWFFVERDSPTVRNLLGRPDAGVSLSSTSTWISLSGKGEVVKDDAKAEQLWNGWVEAWLPQGPKDPSVALIKFHAETAEYWDTPGGRISSLLSFAKAKVTGERYDGGENATVNLP